MMASGLVTLSQPLPSQDVAPRSVSSTCSFRRNPIWSDSFTGSRSQIPLLFASHCTMTQSPCPTISSPSPVQLPALWRCFATVNTRSQISSSSASLRVLVKLSRCNAGRKRAAPSNNTLLIAIAINTSSREKPCSFTGILLFLLADKAGVFPTAKPPATTRPLSF